MLSFGVTVLPDPPYTRLVEVLQNAEEQGFEYGWTYDSHILWQESYALLAIAATQTKKIKLGHCVTNPGIRDPTITASWYATMPGFVTQCPSLIFFVCVAAIASSA